MNTNNTQLVQISGDRPVTTSLAVSNNFGKKHKDVLRAIQNLECSKEFTERNGQAQSRLPFRPPRYGAPAALHRNGTESGGSRQTLGHCAVQRARALGLTEYRPDPKYRNRHALAAAHGQQSLGLEG